MSRSRHGEAQIHSRLVGFSASRVWPRGKNPVSPLLSLRPLCVAQPIAGGEQVCADASNIGAMIMTTIAQERTSGDPVTAEPIDPGVRIGHVHLKVADLDRALAFYCGVLGFGLKQRYGSQAAFISAGGYHHHIGLNTWESRGASAPPRQSTGLYHMAIRYPTRAALARALRALLERRYPLEGASNHGVSEAIYIRDPDKNGIELYWDRPREDWPKADDGTYKMGVERLDLGDLLAADDEGEQEED
jgi:catechol 2,3-dioxygenase